MRKDRSVSKKTLIAGAFALVVIAVSFTLNTAQAASAKSSAQILETRSKLIPTRQATKADVKSGFAASTKSKIYLCSKATNLKNPLSNKLDKHVYIAVGWEESADSHGNPDARINTGTSLIVHNEKSYIIFWSAAQYENAYSGYLYDWTHWKYVLTYLNMVAANGGSLGMRVRTLDGLVDENKPRTGTWETVESHKQAMRTWIAWTGSSQPMLDITLWGSGSNSNKSSLTEVFIDPTNAKPCGKLSSNP